ncbi:hypothetical protein Pmani_030432 [Petrolisthes manimaculis]|uniref:Uncharacterized protein n=1 Tax=Petrolisthes manimaculis TaxID=1843537 RepID=A0AAE1NXB9_9EUCA|nr:hypothetical protein Pmani_030432 [Petrolisthes manimaculis]
MSIKIQGTLLHPPPLLGKGWEGFSSALPPSPHQQHHLVRPPHHHDPRPGRVRHDKPPPPRPHHRPPSSFTTRFAFTHDPLHTHTKTTNQQQQQQQQRPLHSVAGDARIRPQLSLLRSQGAPFQ